MQLAPLGPHIQAGVSPWLNLIQKWQPAVCTVIDPGQDANEIKQRSPGTFVLGRIYMPDLEQKIRSLGPASAARQAHMETLQKMQPGVDAWQVTNEILQDYEGLGLLDDFECARMELADAEGYKCGIMGFSVGNPDLPESDRMSLWRRVYPALRQAAKGAHELVIHQYGKRNLWGPADKDWFIYRFEKQVYPRLPKDIRSSLSTIVSEYGVDNMIWEPDPKPSGWKDTMTASNYVAQLVQAGDHSVDLDAGIRGRTVFTLGHYNPWQTYDIAGEVASSLASVYANRRDASVPTPGVPPVDPPQGGSVDTRLSDAYVAGNLSLSHGKKYYVAEFFSTRDGRWTGGPSDPYSCPLWARKYQSESFDDAGGATHLFIRMEDKNGRPIAGRVLFRTVDGQHKYSANTGDKSSRWQNMFMAGSSAYWPNEGQRGPWIWGPEDDPDCFMLGGGLPYRHHVSYFLVVRELPDGATKPDPKPDPKPDLNEDRVFYPVELMMARISQRFGERYEHYMQKYGTPGHNGLDVAAPKGTPVHSIAEGTVAWVDVDPGYGKYVRVWHPKLLMHSFYAHLDTVSVRAGQHVDPFAALGSIGSTGDSTGPHLHLEFRLADADGNYVRSPLYGHGKGRIDPLSFYDTQDRLLPG